MSDLNEQEIRADERLQVCRREGHDWRETTTNGERAQCKETAICARCGASSVTVTTQEITEWAP